MATHPYMPSCVPVMLRAHAGSNLKAGRRGQVSYLQDVHTCAISHDVNLCALCLYILANSPCTLRHN